MMKYGLFAAEVSVNEHGETVYDRSVGDEYFAELFSVITQNGVAGGGFAVTAGTGMSVNVAAGAAVIEGRFCYDKAAAQLPVSGSGLVVLRLDVQDRSISLQFAQGAAAPTRTANIYELALARVDIPAGSAEMAASMITDLRTNSEFCGIAGAQVSVDSALSSTSDNAVSNRVITDALNGKQSTVRSITLSNGDTYVLADNTEYRGTGITSLVLQFPAGVFHSWLRFSTGESAPTVSMPSSVKYIGEAPVFGVNQTWEMSVKDGVVVAQEVT